MAVKSSRENKNKNKKKYIKSRETIKFNFISRYNSDSVKKFN